jgi:tripartite-type tricarboxylate transporter receptor subunit TctC
VFGSWALVAPATLPLDILETIRRETTVSLVSPKVLERLTSRGVDLKGSSQDELRGFMRSESQRWQALVKEIGLQPQ